MERNLQYRIKCLYRGHWVDQKTNENQVSSEWTDSQEEILRLWKKLESYWSKNSDRSIRGGMKVLIECRDPDVKDPLAILAGDKNFDWDPLIQPPPR